MNYILNINKPPNITSHDVVDRVRQITGIRKIGHAGTLDPFATGVLIILIDRATKKQQKFMRQEKEYYCVIILGATSDTFDRTGRIQKISDARPSRQEIEETIKDFIGTIEQTPPLYSAIKIQGKRLYQLARKGIKVKPEPRKVTIRSIKILKYVYPYITIQVTCESGTYIRSLANDIGEKLGVGGYIQELIRIRIGNYSIEHAIDLETLDSNNWKELSIEILDNV